jgi:hypothetical protein
MKEMDTLDYSKVAAVAFGHDMEKIPAKLAYIERAGTEIDLGLQNNPPLTPPKRGIDNTPITYPSREIASPRVCADAGVGMRARTQDTEIGTRITYSRHDVFKEIRFRLKLERIMPVQSQVIEQVLGERQSVEESVIEEICGMITGTQNPKSEIRNPKSEMAEVRTA